MDIFLEIDTIVLFVILVELAFLVYHIRRMSKQDRCMTDLIQRLDEHGAKLDRFTKQTEEDISELDAKIEELLRKA